VPYRHPRPVQDGIGAPSDGVGTTGAATAVYAQIRPTIRNNILTARFIGLSLLVKGLLGAATLTGHELYKVLSSVLDAGANAAVLTSSLVAARTLD